MFYGHGKAVKSKTLNTVGKDEEEMTLVLFIKDKKN